MDDDVDLVVLESDLELLGEEALVPDLGEGDVLDLVAGRRASDYLDLEVREDLLQLGLNVVGLDECELK